MPKFLLLLAILVCSCSSPVTPPPRDLAPGATTATIVFGFRAGFGSETYYRYRDGQWYGTAYTTQPSRGPDPRINREALATDESNWSLIGPAPADVIALVESLPLDALETIEDRNDCAALAYDGGCPLVGVYRNATEGYVEWFGDFKENAAVADYMNRVEALVQDYEY